jgi:5-oxoprolinase (ATP-hydrolysing)
MCRPIRALTEARGHAMSKHMCAYFILFYFGSNKINEMMMIDCLVFRLASFGGAGGQHACEIASLLGIKTILIHRYSSILSAYGLALADR